jgi:hypothetical protein
MAVDQEAEHVIRVPSGCPATRLGKYVTVSGRGRGMCVSTCASLGFISVIKIVVIVAIELGVIFAVIEQTS